MNEEKLYLPGSWSYMHLGNGGDRKASEWERGENLLAGVALAN